MACPPKTQGPSSDATNSIRYEDIRPRPFNVISDVFQFAEEIQELQFNDNDILVSYDVSALFTNVPQDETIQILANKAFSQNWFNETHNLKISQDHLVELLRVVTETSTFPVQL